MFHMVPLGPIKPKPKPTYMPWRATLKARARKYFLGPMWEEKIKIWGARGNVHQISKWDNCFKIFDGRCPTEIYWNVWFLRQFFFLSILKKKKKRLSGFGSKHALSLVDGSVGHKFMDSPYLVWGDLGQSLVDVGPTPDARLLARTRDFNFRTSRLRCRRDVLWQSRATALLRKSMLASSVAATWHLARIPS